MVEIDDSHLDTLERLKGLFGQSDIVINGDIIIEKGTVEKKRNVQKIRNTPGANSWKQKVRQRDKVCQCCRKSEHLEVHHIMPLAEYPQLATDIHNGIVLCQLCHRDYHAQWKGSEGSATLVKFLREQGQFL